MKFIFWFLLLLSLSENLPVANQTQARKPEPRKSACTFRELPSGEIVKVCR
jgi:hypothetical protein